MIKNQNIRSKALVSRNKAIMQAYVGTQLIFQNNIKLNIEIMNNYIGEIRMFASGVVPAGWLACEGQVLNISEYTALHSLISNNYGGDGTTTFALPDLRMRMPVGHNGNLATSGGTAQVSIIEANMPSHTHTAQATASGASVGGTATAAMKVNNTESSETAPSGMYLGTSSTELYTEEATANTLATDAITVDTSGLTVDVSGLTVTVDNTGSGEPLNNMSPYLAINFCIATTGLYPEIA
jgi:microcystin-dependent protein